MPCQPLPKLGVLPLEPLTPPALSDSQGWGRVTLQPLARGTVTVTGTLTVTGTSLLHQGRMEQGRAGKGRAEKGGDGDPEAAVSG